MSMFQKSVLNKYLTNLNKDEIEKSFQKFSNIFIPEKIKNIKNSKEEEYQDGFLADLFVNILGYIKSPDPGFNLRREYKNQSDSKKADGAIIKDGKAVAVIELKSTKTKDLESITAQAFGYKNNQPECRYIITSNFHKLRFYIDNKTEYEEFDLFNLDKENFERLYLILNKDNLLSDIPLTLKKESLLHEEDISKKLYKDYSIFKNKLFENLIKNNPKYNKLILFKKTQKLIDRFLFILFAEDKGLLPPNSINRIIERFESLSDMDAYKPLYDIYKQYFGYMNKGRAGKVPADDIPAYNGGLFYADKILDNLKIDDVVLIDDLKHLSSYDFVTEVDVNILGHIFEHSLSEIEEITAEIEGNALDNSKSKRKKDGVFYTPKYITHYIVEQTIGNLCTEKRKELEILNIEIDSSYHTKKGLSKKGKLFVQKLEDYKTWLLSLKILDPACGSGAFLNQALNFLIKEHEFISDTQNDLQGGSGATSFMDIDIAVLENNIFGVDINEESVEIAKLSLWLRTAQKGRKLSILSNNIKCGNSLIDDPKVAGDKAFNWKKDFPEIMKNGGFDVVIGNPPYVNMSEFPKFIHSHFEKNYSLIHTGYNDLMYYFLYKGIDLLKKSGVFGVITSNYFIGNEYAKSLRNFLSNHISKLLSFGDYQVFQDANIHTAIVFAEKKPQKNNVCFETYNSVNPINEIIINPKTYTQAIINRENLTNNWIIADDSSSKLIEKLSRSNTFLGDISEIAKGSESGKNNIFTVDNTTIELNNIESGVLKKCVKNSDIRSYQISFSNQYLIYSDNNFSYELYPNAYKYLEKFKEVLLERRGPRTGEYEWWRLHRPSVKDIFESDEKIIVPYRASENRFGYDNKQYFNNGGDIRAIKITSNNYDTKFVTAVLNSKLMNWYYGFIGKPKGGLREYFNKPLALIPIPEISKDKQTTINLQVDLIIENKQKNLIIIDNFLKYIQSQISIEKFSKKLNSWQELVFGEFIKELNKANKKAGGERLTKMEEMEWMEVFETKKEEVQKMKTEISQMDKAIDQMVYALYGLTEEEIKTVESV